MVALVADISLQHRSLEGAVHMVTSINRTCLVAAEEMVLVAKVVEMEAVLSGLMSQVSRKTRTIPQWFSGG